jgi:UDPglucose--hexose-1-phosphate uridylyltransferase
VGAIREVIDMYCARIDDISKIDGIAYVLVFKNHGEEAGTSLSHEHSQLIALPQVPTLVEEELCAYKKYYDRTKKCIFCDIMTMEMNSERKIFENDKFVCFAPFASRFPFESWLLPKRHAGNITDLTDEEKNSLAESLKKVLTALSKMLKNPPYNYYLHIAPAREDFHFHIEICPRVTKLAGFELGSDIIINTMPPERAAAEFRNLF